MNITEFAQYAGVSKAAVSRYFNGGYLSADKRARIEAAVEATGYQLLFINTANDPHTVPRSQMLGYELVCRESTGD